MPGALPRRLLALLTACTLVWSIGRAQPVDQAQFQKFLASKANKDLIIQALSTARSEVFRPCPGMGPLRAQVEIETPIAFGADGVPTSGEWWERFPIMGCDNDTLLNVHFRAVGDGRIEAKFTLPGSTRTPPGLQGDAVQQAMIGAASRARDCPQFHVKTTHFGGYGLKNPLLPDPGKDAQFRAWWETWTVIGCGRSYDVLMQFMPDTTGTKIIQPRDEVIEY